MKKKWIAIGTVATLFIATYVAYANDANEGIEIIIHGKEVESKESAKIEKGTTFVPLRVIAENLNQDVQWDSKTKTVTVEPKRDPSDIERMVVQRDRDIMVLENPEAREYYSQAKAFISTLQSLYGMTYRGFLSTDLNADIEIKTEDDLSIIQDSLTTVERSVESSYKYVRLVQTPYIPQPGQNAPPRKDILFYIDATNPNDLHIAVQNPVKLTEWRVYRVRDYGSWLEKEIDIIAWTSGGY